MFPRTRLIPLAGVAPLAAGVLLLAACGEPPQPLPTSPPYASLVSPSGVAVGGLPTPVATTPTLPVLALPTGVAPTYPYPTQTVGTAAPTVKSASPTPSHAPKCAGEPTGAQILALIKGKKGVPSQPLKVDEGPFCAADWSFTTVELADKTEDQLEPLMVVAYGKGASLGLLAAGSDVCNQPVQSSAPPGIRVLACGF